MSDDEDQYNAKSHKNLLQAISSLGKVQHIRKTTRSEPQIQQDEFQLVKGATAVVNEENRKRNPVGINDIVEILRTTKQHVDTGKELRNVQKTKKVLKVALEKPAADRIKRTVGYETVKKKLERWDAVVAKNRSAETQIFPLKTETIYINTSAHAKPLQMSLKSQLRDEMEATDAKLKALRKERIGDTENEKDLAQRESELLKRKLTRDELIAKRRELAYVKMRESQQSAKARMQNKIKSKKYHKLLKRQKLQEQVKQFELLQKTNPEAALEKLNELEKSRVLERANLRHKNTGTWAKNLQIRAKYDKDVRKDLAEQLQISRELTQKKTEEEHSDDDMAGKQQSEAMEMAAENAANDPFNPWTKVAARDAAKKQINGKNEKENWRKYWLERNENEKLLEEYKGSDGKDNNEKNVVENNIHKEEIVVENFKELRKKSDQINKQTTKTLTKPKQIVDEKSMEISITKPVKTKAAKSMKQKSDKKPVLENGWLVEELPAPAPKSTKDIDDIFDAQEDKIKRQLSKKLKLLSKQAKKMSQKTSKTKSFVGKDALKNLKDLSFKNEAKRPIIDEALNNEEQAAIDNKKTELDETLTKVAAPTVNKNAPIEAASTTDTIDPNKLATVKLKQHLSALHGINDSMGEMDFDLAEVEEDENPHTAHQMTISQAFEDDDIIADFSKDKTKESELKNTEVTLSLPGWGSWAGSGISEERTNNRNKRLVLKLNKEVDKRRDDNKHDVYINEEASKQMRAHLVSDLPFPFTSLQDYEASIRAPIGRNFVPETAFRMLTRPEIITLKGQVIEPMDESELVKPARKLRHVVDRRIRRAEAVAAK